MPEIGQTLSHFRIIEKIGAGGMGTVFLAEDLTLDRKVALKFLPEAFTSDPERMARFEREAKLLASLNHPNIAGIHGLEQAGGSRFLVLEYVEGETLQARLSKGALPLEEALELCRQIAEGLEAAHEKGVIHRDLKPANVMITSEEEVKILDFGLAKALSDETQGIDSSQSPTLTEAMTRPGVILGTAAYMSPEQAKGKSVDKRADIWAFGCILYECLTGRKAFEGETVTETLAAVIRGEPNWEALPETAPLSVRMLLRRSLKKERNRRFRDAADVGIEIEESLVSPQKMQDILAGKNRRGNLLWGSAVLVLFILGGLIAWILKPLQPPVAQPIVRVEMSLPSGDRFETAFPLISISPDGRHLAYTAIRADVLQIFVRPIDSYEAIPLSGTEGAVFPFFSPDSKWIGFFARGKLKKIPIHGGAVIDLCDAGHFGGASWGIHDNIVFTDSLTSGLLSVSSDGGDRQVLTTPDREQGENSHRLPQFLPDGQTLLYTVQIGGGGWDEYEIWALRLDTGERHKVLTGGHTGCYVPTKHSTGHLVYCRQGSLRALPFDPIHLKVIGDSSDSKTVVESILGTGGISAGLFSSSAAGLFAYIPANRRQLDRSLVWVDREGYVETVSRAPVRPYYWVNKGVGLSIAPDGRRVAVQIESNTTEIQIFDLERGVMDKFSSEDGGSSFPIWTPDGERIAYTGYRKGLRNIYWKNADGTGEEEGLTTGENHKYPSSFSRDGTCLIFGEVAPETGDDLYTLRLDGDRRQEPFLNNKWGEFMGRLSNDGNWLAYASNEKDQPDVYVTPFPGPGASRQISNEGGNMPLWSHDDSELFYRNGDRMMAVSIKTEPTFWSGEPEVLFEGQFGPGDLAEDGRFLMVRPVEPESPATKINLILNFFEELKQKAPLP